MLLINTELLICTQQHEIHILPTDGYPFFLVFSLDTLLVIDRSKEVVIEWIHVGQDNAGYVLQARDEDLFLDAILVAQEAISKQEHPLQYFLNLQQ